MLSAAAWREETVVLKGLFEELVDAFAAVLVGACETDDLKVGLTVATDGTLGLEDSVELWLDVRIVMLVLWM